MRDLGPRPLPVSPLEGVKNFFSIAIFSVTAADSAAVLSALGAALGSLSSAPDVRAPYPKFGGEGPPTKISPFATLIFLAVREINETHMGCRHYDPQWNGDVTEPLPHLVSTLGGAKRQSSNSIFSVTATDIDTVLSLLRAAF